MQSMQHQMDEAIVPSNDSILESDNSTNWRNNHNFNTAVRSFRPSNSYYRLQTGFNTAYCSQYTNPLLRSPRFMSGYRHTARMTGRGTSVPSHGFLHGTNNAIITEPLLRTPPPSTCQAQSAMPVPMSSGYFPAPNSVASGGFSYTSERDSSDFKLIRTPRSACNRYGTAAQLHTCFDMALCRSRFPRVNSSSSEFFGDEDLMQTLTKRAQSIQIPKDRLNELNNFVNMFMNIVQSIAVNPALVDFEICEVKEIGSYKYETLLYNEPRATLLLVVRSLPTHMAVHGLAEYLSRELSKQYSPYALEYEMIPEGFWLTFSPSDTLPLSQESLALVVMVAAVSNLIPKCDPNLHIKAQLQEKGLRMIAESQWFEENASHTNCKMLHRLMKDICRRFDGLSHLDDWSLLLLVHHATMYNPRNIALPIDVAFRRVFQLLAAGIFLPGSAGIFDPCEPSMRVHMRLSLEQQDEICGCAQTLLNISNYGGIKDILGISDGLIDNTDLRETTVWNGITLKSPVKVYYPDSSRDAESLSDSRDER